jgi:hypothetical protein
MEASYEISTTWDSGSGTRGAKKKNKTSILALSLHTNPIQFFILHCLQDFICEKGIVGPTGLG